MTTTDECPCRYCVPPKRHTACHGSCSDYIEWNDRHQKRLEMIRENKKTDKAFQSMKYETLRRRERERESRR